MLDRARISSEPEEARELGRVFESAAGYLALLAEPTRLRILHAICSEEHSVGEIVSLTGISQTNVSRHLAMMYRARVLHRRRSGNAVYYSVADATLIEICRSVCAHVALGTGAAVFAAPRRLR